jgi:RHS repeat-associated protein
LWQCRFSSRGRGRGGQNIFEQISSGGTVTYLHHDQQGSTRLITGEKGEVTDAYTYSPYGETTGHTGTATTPLGYDAQYTSSDTGLIYMRARTYDPATGQFLTRDPLAAISGEPYSYACALLLRQRQSDQLRRSFGSRQLELVQLMLLYGMQRHIRKPAFRIGWTGWQKEILRMLMSISGNGDSRKAEQKIGRSDQARGCKGAFPQPRRFAADEGRRVRQTRAFADSAFIAVLTKSDGIFLEHFEETGADAGDSWHQSIEEAKEQAREEYGGENVGVWTPVPESEEDVFTFGLRLVDMHQ